MNKQQLIENIRTKRSFLCVGLDTDLKKIPQHLIKEEDPIFVFNNCTLLCCLQTKPRFLRMLWP